MLKMLNIFKFLITFTLSYYLNIGRENFRAIFLSGFLLIELWKLTKVSKNV